MHYLSFASLCSALCIVGATRTPKLERQNGGEVMDHDVDVSITWVRHGLSCANIANKAAGGWCCAHAGRWLVGSAVNAMGFTDPPLSDCGVARSAYLGWTRYAEKAFDFVGASVLSRAIETAAHMFRRNKIFVLPFVSEQGHAECNEPRPLADQMEFLSEEKGYNISWNFLADWRRRYEDESLTVHSLKARDPYVPKVDWAMDFLSELISDLLLTKNTSELRVAIVSHGNFMRRLPGFVHSPGCEATATPYNNEARTISYKYSSKMGLRLAEPHSCAMEEGYRTPKRVCEAEYQRCPARFMRTVRPSSCGCEELDPMAFIRNSSKGDSSDEEKEAPSNSGSDP